MGRPNRTEAACLIRTVALADLDPAVECMAVVEYRPKMRKECSAHFSELQTHSEGQGLLEVETHLRPCSVVACPGVYTAVLVACLGVCTAVLVVCLGVCIAFLEACLGECTAALVEACQEGALIVGDHKKRDMMRFQLARHAR